MAVYESKYKELGFYVDGKLVTFKGGRYVTEDAKEIKALENVKDAVRVDKPAEEKEKPATKKAPARKSSEK